MRSTRSGRLYGRAGFIGVVGAGMTTGEVDADWAARHHAKWAAEETGS